MRVLALVLLVACGGGSGEVEGDPLIQSSLMGQFNNKPWTPMYGFGRTETSKSGSMSFAMYVGSTKISCEDKFSGVPRDGTYGVTSVPTPPAVTSTSTMFSLVEVINNDLSNNSGIPFPGTVQVTAASETEVSAVFAYDQTINAARYSLTGAVTMLRCP
jgi:hypothetical protein